MAKSFTKNNGYVKEWLLLAESSYEIARLDNISDKIRYEDLCFQAQQAAEKALKAMLIYYNKPFTKTHEIQHLLELLKEAGVIIPKSIAQAKLLSAYVINIRTFDDIFDKEKITKKEYKQVVALADKILQWAKLMTEKHPDELF